MHHNPQAESKNETLYLVGLFIALLIPSICLPLQTTETVNGGVPQQLTAFHSPDWKFRANAFYGLIQGLSGPPAHSIQGMVQKMLAQHPAEEGPIKLGLIGLLHTENANVEDFKKRNAHFGEDYSNYYGDVIGVIAALEDVRSMPELLGAITTGDMATRTLAGFGEIALPPVLSKLNDPDPLVRGAALFTLLEMVEMDKVKETTSITKIKKAFLKALNDPDGSVRGSAVFGLEKVGVKNAIPLLTQIAKHDPDVLKGQKDGGGDFYPVREAAEAEIARIRKGTH